MTATDNVNQRNYGIDLLRLIAAFYVVLLHVLYQGGLFDAVTPYSFQDYICRMILIFSFCAVNIFGIISGYVGYRETNSIGSFSNYLTLWLTVVFYGVVITLAFMFISPGVVTGRDLCSVFFPLTKGLYWYFSAYTLVFFVTPYLNRIICQMSDKSLRRVFCLICFVIVPIEYMGKSFGMADGYSAMWLINLYLVGAIIKKTGIGCNISSFTAILAICAINIILFYLNLKTPNMSFFIFHFCFELNYSYITPFYLASAFFHFILFSRFKFHRFGQALISFAAPAAFSVYIANVQESFWVYYMKDRFAHWAASSPAGLLVRVVGFSIVFVLIVVLVDYFRRKLFQLLRVRHWGKNISRVLMRDTVR